MRAGIVALITFTMALAGCTGTDYSGSDTGSEGNSMGPSSHLSSASIYVKDAPTDDFTEVHVVFTEVQVHMAGADDDNATSWVTLFNSTDGVDVDLLAASGDASAFLGEASLAAGKYTQIRISVASAYGVDAGGNTTNITVSSGTLKINHPFDVEEGSEAQITVDYDLDRSLKATGKTYRMTPVIGSVVVEHVSDDSSGDDVDEAGDIGAKHGKKGGDEESDDDMSGDNMTADDNVTA